MSLVKRPIAHPFVFVPVSDDGPFEARVRMPCGSNVHRVKPFPEIQTNSLPASKHDAMERNTAPIVVNPDGEGTDATLAMGAVMAGELRHHDKRHPETDDANAQGAFARGQRKRPFDTSGVSWVPDHDEDDPPYRDWWVVEDEREGE
jgi:hypothetical protein